MQLCCAPVRFRINVRRFDGNSGEVMNFDLPIISPDANPEFADAAACADWLKDLPLINVGPAHGRLLGQLEELNCFGMPPGERIKILEMMLDAVAFVQAEHAIRPDRHVVESG